MINNMEYVESNSEILRLMEQEDDSANYDIWRITQHEASDLLKQKRECKAVPMIKSRLEYLYAVSNSSHHEVFEWISRLEELLTEMELNNKEKMKERTNREINVREILHILRRIYSHFSVMKSESISSRDNRQKLVPIKNFNTFIFDYILKGESVSLLGNGYIGDLEISTNRDGISWDFSFYSEILSDYEMRTKKIPQNCWYFESYGCTHQTRTHEETEYWSSASTQDFTLHKSYDFCSMNCFGKGCKEYENKNGKLTPLILILEEMEINTFGNKR